MDREQSLKSTIFISVVTTICLLFAVVSAMAGVERPNLDETEKARKTIYSETFDGQQAKAGQSVLDAPFGWTLVHPNDPAKKNVGNVFLGAGKHGWAGNYLDGATASGKEAENVFHKTFAAVGRGLVVLSCRAFASGETSVGTSIALCPAQPHFASRAGGWISTAKGWTFWVNRVDAGVYPQGEQKAGSTKMSQESLTGAHDVAVHLKTTVDLDRNKAWGEARWKDARGGPRKFKSAVYDWDTAGGNIACLVVDVDTRGGHTGIAIDDLRVEGIPPAPQPNPPMQWKHEVRQLNNEKESVLLPAEMQWISRPWNGENAQMPYLVYMPEKDRLLMTVSCRKPCVEAVITSDDHGKTWSERRWMRVDKDGKPAGGGIGLTYLGQGKLIAFGGDLATRWFSSDYGQTWTTIAVKVPQAKTYFWDPALVMRGADGRVELVAQGCYHETGLPWPRGAAKGPYSHGCILLSRDEGQTWCEQIEIPQWTGLNEIVMARANNGDWVAACRTDGPQEFSYCSSDQYSGLVVSTSKDQGKTWSKPNVLHEWGRHHPSLMILADGRLLLTYVVRAGYPFNAQGYPEFGVEAVVSNDNGQTWDMEHRYILAKWAGNIRGDDGWYCGVQSSSTVLLPDGTLLTAFGTGFRNMPGTLACMMDVALLKWRVNSQPRAKD